LQMLKGDGRCEGGVAERFKKLMECKGPETCDNVVLAWDGAKGCRN
jgi:hypothetical protein